MGPELGAFWGAREPPPGGAPRVHKKCTFFWVFNNSPSRDRIRAFFFFFWPGLSVDIPFELGFFSKSQSLAAPKSGIFDDFGGESD